MIKIKSFGSGSKGNAYLIDDGHTQLLIEAGISFKKVQQEMSFDFSKVVGCLISHEHRDHCSQISQLLQLTNIDIYATKGTVDSMQKDSVLKIGNDTFYRFNNLIYKETTKIGTWFVTPFDVQHDASEPAGFLIDNTSGDRLVFVTDSYYVKYQFPNVSHIMVEMNYSRNMLIENYGTYGFKNVLKTRIIASHFEFQNSLEFIKRNKSHNLKEVFLLHLSETNAHRELFKKESQKISGVPVYIA